MKQKMAGLILVAVLASVLLSGCGSGTEQTSTESDDSYQEIELVMAVNGTDIQIDTKVAKKFAELVEEESGGRVTVAVFPNDQLAGGNSTKGIEILQWEARTWRPMPHPSCRCWTARCPSPRFRGALTITQRLEP